MTDPGNARALVSLTLSFRPLANQIGPLRTLLSDLCKPHLADADGLSRLLLAAHELLENVVKYSTGEAAEFHLLLEAKASGLLVHVREPEAGGVDAWRALADRAGLTAHRFSAFSSPSISTSASAIFTEASSCTWLTPIHVS